MVQRWVAWCRGVRRGAGGVRRCGGAAAHGAGAVRSECARVEAGGVRHGTNELGGEEGEPAVGCLAQGGQQSQAALRGGR